MSYGRRATLNTLRWNRKSPQLQKCLNSCDLSTVLPRPGFDAEVLRCFCRSVHLDMQGESRSCMCHFGSVSTSDLTKQENSSKDKNIHTPHVMSHCFGGPARLYGYTVYLSHPVWPRTVLWYGHCIAELHFGCDTFTAHLDRISLFSTDTVRCRQAWDLGAELEN